MAQLNKNSLLKRILWTITKPSKRRKGGFMQQLSGIGELKMMATLAI